ncbi:C-4 methylsterol oxidase [Schizosaccharomyces japonicus yFS275]|uniref:C-4 methylsterol oxidase n=1 Tax=Schizosaccharomyces japonicus (strain yFS275 / FY16936) TaxID=402676 RepID=B6K337_SCHJY|nr:C-4 methylsterol oxidase [Schizosaccharomyces japonicus yFS275]EEB07894.1 C-4 methylsterol oxidase [Schizosaccharomyces japonicus yFS275]
MNTTTELYTGMSFSAVRSLIGDLHPELNAFEKLWLAYYKWFGNDVVATGLMSFLMHEIIYFGRCIPWMIIDAIPYFRRWKIQPKKVPSMLEQWQCTRLVLLSHFTVELPQIWLFDPMCAMFGLSTAVPFPSWQKICWQVAMFFVLEDTWHYWAHRLFHYGIFYRWIHKVHHKYSAPFGLSAEYAHPAEIVLLGAGTVFVPLVWCYFTHDLHLVTMYIWITCRLLQAVDSHSGYDFPWSLNKFLPFWAGADHHDYHHMAFKDNFASSFRWWDRTLRTDQNYHAWKDRQTAKKLEAQQKKTK